MQRFEGEYLGRWPTADSTAIWSDGLWKAASAPITWNDVQLALDDFPRIGCDVARLGENRTCFHVTWGDYSVFHEARRGWRTTKTTGRLIELAEHWAGQVTVLLQAANKAAPPVDPKSIVLVIDDSGVGGGVSDQLMSMGYTVRPVNSSTKAGRSDRYPNKRSELWFQAPERARIGKIKCGLLPQGVLADLRRQLMAPTWEMVGGQRVVEEKERTAVRLGGAKNSPDDADAFNLAWYEVEFRAPEVLHLPRPSFGERMEASKERQQQPAASSLHRPVRPKRRGLFGQGR